MGNSKRRSVGEQPAAGEVLRDWHTYIEVGGEKHVPGEVGEPHTSSKVGGEAHASG
jgi:hypothetical protein